MGDSPCAELGSEHLGVGLDIFQYDPLRDAPLPRQGRVVDVDAALVRSQDVPGGRTEEIYGSNYAEFARQIAVKIGVEGKYGGFAASLHAGLTTSTHVAAKSQWLRIERVINGKFLTIGEDPGVLSEHLDPDFLRAVSDMSPSELFDAYGTHVVVKLTVGGRASYDCSSSESSTMTQSEFTAAATAKYASLGGQVAGTVDARYASESYASQVRGSTSLDLCGGSDGAIAQLQVEKSAAAWMNWLDSVGARPSVLGFGPDGLLPIWELVAEADRKRGLEHEYRRRLAQHPLVLVFTATSPSEAHPSCIVEVPEGYKLLSGGACDNFVSPGNHLYASCPNGDTGWEVRGKDHLKPSPSTVTAYAIALHDPQDLWDVAITSETVPASGSPTATVRVKDGYTLVGGGASIDWRWSQGPGNHLTASRPQEEHGSWNSWYAAGHDHTRPCAAAMTVYAIGLQSKVDGITVTNGVTHSSSSETSWPGQAQLVASRHVLTGGGAECFHSHAWGQILTASYPETSTRWRASSKDHLKPDVGRVAAYAVGIRVE